MQIFHIINLNCLAVLALTYKYAKIFKEKTKGGKHCAILNVGSIAGTDHLKKAKFRYLCLMSTLLPRDMSQNLQKIWH